MFSGNCENPCEISSGNFLFTLNEKCGISFVWVDECLDMRWEVETKKVPVVTSHRNLINNQFFSSPRKCMQAVDICAVGMLSVACICAVSSMYLCCQKHVSVL